MRRRGPRGELRLLLGRAGCGSATPFPLAFTGRRRAGALPGHGVGGGRRGHGVPRGGVQQLPRGLQHQASCGQMVQKVSPLLLLLCLQQRRLQLLVLGPRLQGKNATRVRL